MKGNVCAKVRLSLPGFEYAMAKPADVVLTPPDIARSIVEEFRPHGRILDPCSGEGAFLRHMPGADYCEIREGRDFFTWNSPVDWIVSNPPYSIFSNFLRHSFSVAREIVYLIPINKAFNSDKMMREIWEWGGIRKILVIGGGAQLGFPIGFCVGAVHFSRKYDGQIELKFLGD